MSRSYDPLERLKNRTLFAKSLPPPVFRVCRRGFRRDIRRGDDERRWHGIYRVIRRTARYLYVVRISDIDDIPRDDSTIDRIRYTKPIQIRESFHFIDQYGLMVKRAGVLLEDVWRVLGEVK